LGLLLPLAVAVSACADRSALDASSGQLSLHLADAALAAGAPDLALNVTGSILAPHPRDIDALATEGDAHYVKGELAPAEQAYRAVLAIDPGSARGEIGLGRILLQSDPIAAEAAFLHALQREPRNITALSNLGVARDLQERHAEAQLAYRQALDIAPDNAATLASLGLSLALSGDAGSGVRILRPLASDPAAPARVRDNLAVALTLAGDTSGAERALGADLSQPETATAIAGYRALATSEQALAMLVQSRSVPTYAELTASGPHAVTEEPGLEPATAVPSSAAASPPTAGLQSNKPTEPQPEQSRSTVAALPDISPPARALAPAVETSTTGPATHEPRTVTQPDPSPVPPATVIASSTSFPETQPASMPARTLTEVAATPEVAAPSTMDLAMLLRAIEAGRSVASSTADTVPAPPAAPMSLWLAEAGVDITMPFAALESSAPPGGAMLAVALPADLPTTEVQSWAGESWPLAVAQVPAPSVLPAIPGVPPTARIETAQKPAAERAAVVPGQQPPVQQSYVQQASGQQPYVQVAAVGTQQAASSEWERLRAKTPDLMSGRSPTVQQAEVNGRMFWRLRTTGFVTLADANAFCGRLQAAGSNCWTMLATPPS
ncbi:MAG TPA: SPOR domain-containing protein, partial [Acetobacteraceae bacterium]|nr:SPOR domain-containing protein [Acetobacteraceae bacterium]